MSSKKECTGGCSTIVHNTHNYISVFYSMFVSRNEIKKTEVTDMDMCNNRQIVTRSSKIVEWDNTVCQ